ncbi:MAG: bifunctional DNA-formamidopyrimidine glycosylase/DNA-(apurinic or apyrimidinic site) lyase [Methylophilaceae bacterium]
MPELPEVEVTCIGLKPLLSYKVSQVNIRNFSLRWPINPNLSKILKDQVLINLSRRGKYILARFSKGTLILHLGMSGRLCVVPTGEIAQKHDHVDIIFDSNCNKTLRYRDPRRFGCILWTEEDPLNHKLIHCLGPEPLTNTFNNVYLFKKLRKKTQAIKNSIMDGHLVVGVGNIYSSESLFQAGIRPDRPSYKVTKKEALILVASIKNVIKDAIAKGGSTLNDFYDVDGKNGYFQNEHQVYGRAGDSCIQCGEMIHQIRIGQRSSFYCRKCQK